jgi:hypothetical protein
MGFGMTSTIFYDDVNEIALLTNNFQLNGVNTDPTTVSCVVTDPSGTSVTHTYAGALPADITKPLVGKYSLSVPCSPVIAGIDGLWSYVWIGTGAVSDVQPGTWRVLPESVNQFYCGLEELKDRLGITDNTDDYAAQMAIQAASSWIAEYCAQPFYRLTETRTFRPHDIWALDIDPVITVTALNVDTDGDGVFEQAWVQGTDYQLLVGDNSYNVNAYGVARPYRRVQVLQAGKWFPFVWPYSHLDRIQISGTWGWPAVPPPVAQACLVLAAQWFKEKDAPFGILGTSDFGVTRIQQSPWTVEQLRPYIYTKRKVGV